MTKDSLDTKLTPAAREALEEFIGSYRQQVLRYAQQSASAIPGEIKEISTRDIFDALNRLQSKELDSRTRLRFRLIRITVVLGLAYGFLGLLLYVYSQVDASGFTPKLLADPSFFVTFIGLLMASLAYVYGFLLKNGPTSATWTSYGSTVPSGSKEMALHFLQRWQEVELELRQLAASVLGESKARVPFIPLVQRLTQVGILTPDYYQLFRSLLERRNQLLHQDIAISQSTYLSAMRDIESLLIQLRTSERRPK